MELGLEWSWVCNWGLVAFVIMFNLRALNESVELYETNTHEIFYNCFKKSRIGCLVL